ncbi:membrane protein insertase YidC [Pedobacter sp. ASV28]|uniref:membrane protein insertase YidC n=1 Tax=Pedobacter sp. ASV28 TaxID=2795123 RepID=UPI0018EE0AD3|nr:membrane protein insertase YidC [Pedobacter sp. ASV28]
MDRNTFTGLFLIMIILAGGVFFMKPSEAEINKERAKQTADSLKRIGVKPASQSIATTNNTTKAVDTALLKGPFGSNMNGSEQTTILENANLKITLSNLGGKVLSVEVKNEQTYGKQPVILFNGNENKFGLNLNVDGKPLQTNNLYFTATKNGNGVTMRANYNADKYVDFIYHLPADGYQLDFNVSLNGLNQIIQGNQISLNWETTLLQQEKDAKKEQEHSGPYFKYVAQNPDHLNLHKDEKKEINEGKIEWFSFKQHFFSAVLIPTVPFEKGDLEVKVSTEPGKIKWYGANMQLPFNQLSAQNYAFKFYFGTNKFTTLKAQGHELEKQVDLGYWPLKYINRFIVLPVFNLLESFNWGYGLIILVLTILLKLAMSPLTYKSYISMAKMRILKPEMDEIKAKVGEDNPTLLQQEYLKLYKQVGVNPLGGCLPMLLQLPFVMAFFFFFPNLFELRGESFLWMKDLSTYDDFIKFGFTIPFIGDHLSLMCILMTISTLIYTYFNNQISGATGQMKYIGYIMPIIFLGVLNSYPSGLNYYYFLANMLTFLQQFLIRKMVNDDKIHAILQDNKTKPKTEKKKSKFQARLDEYMRNQQQTQAHQKKGK